MFTLINIGIFGIIGLLVWGRIPTWIILQVAIFVLVLGTAGCATEDKSEVRVYDSNGRTTWVRVSAITKATGCSFMQPGWKEAKTEYADNHPEIFNQ